LKKRIIALKNYLLNLPVNHESINPNIEIQVDNIPSLREEIKF